MQQLKFLGIQGHLHLPGHRLGLRTGRRARHGPWPDRLHVSEGAREEGPARYRGSDGPGVLDRSHAVWLRQNPVFDPSGAKDADGRPIVLGRRIQVNEEQASVIRRIFEWAAEGVGVASIVDRLNREGIPKTRGSAGAIRPSTASSRTSAILVARFTVSRRSSGSPPRDVGLCGTAPGRMENHRAPGDENHLGRLVGQD